ncbi:MAG TPA: hypothetical protein VF870_02250 [Ignavibacteriaceae bacterium]
MKYTYAVISMLLFFQSLNHSQNYDYWKDAPVEGTLIFSIYFVNSQVGYAMSTNTEIFKTSDSGLTWKIEQNNANAKLPDEKNIYWSAEIYCSAMKTEDGGNSWTPYSEKAQEHFCKVYFKDPNVEYKIASEFLYTISEKVSSLLKTNKIETLIGRPQQCTEYYSNEEEGWAVGWCLKNFNQYKNTK